MINKSKDVDEMNNPESEQEADNQNKPEVKPDPVKSARSPTPNGQSIEAVANEDPNRDYYGRLITYTFSDILIPADSLRELYSEIGIPLDYFPKEINDRGAWKRACREIEKKRTYQEKQDTDNPEELTIIHEAIKIKPSVRQIEKTVINSENEEVNHEKIVKFRYEEPKNIQMKTLEGKEEEALKWYNEMMTKYEKLRSNYTQNHIRNTFREKVIHGNKINSVAIRRTGSVYFIPEKHAELIEKFSKLAKTLDKMSNDILEIVAIPVVKQPEQKDMIKRHIKKETVDRTSKVMEKAKEIIEEDKKINPSTYENFIEEMQSLRKKREEYKKLLDAPLDVCEEQINILRQQLQKITDNVKSD